MNNQVTGLTPKVDNCHPELFFIFIHYGNRRSISAQDDPVYFHTGRPYCFFKIGKVGFLRHDDIDIYFHTACIHTKRIFNEVLVIYSEIVRKYMNHFIFIGHIRIIERSLHNTVDLLNGDIFVRDIHDPCRVKAFCISI